MEYQRKTVKGDFRHMAGGDGRKRTPVGEYGADLMGVPQKKRKNIW